MQQLSETAAKVAEAARPWPAGQAELADQTVSRLKVVALLAKDGLTPSMLDSELTFLNQG